MQSVSGVNDRNADLQFIHRSEDMYTRQAIERLNGIQWESIGENGQEQDMELGVEFMRRMAAFCGKNGITPKLPFMTNLASFFMECEIDDSILNECNEGLKKVIMEPTMSTLIVSFFLQASMLADRDNKYIDCIEVYEPIISLFEKGGNFVYRERGMSFIHSGLIPMADWYAKWK